MLKIITSASIVSSPTPCHSSTELGKTYQVPESIFLWDQSCTEQFDPGKETGFSYFILMSAAETFKVEELSPAVNWVAQEVPLLSLCQADWGREELFF